MHNTAAHHRPLVTCKAHKVSSNTESEAKRSTFILFCSTSTLKPKTVTYRPILGVKIEKNSYYKMILYDKRCYIGLHCASKTIPILYLQYI